MLVTEVALVSAVVPSPSHRVSAQDGRFCWKHFHSRTNESRQMPMDFVSRVFHLAVTLATQLSLDAIALNKGGFDSAFAPLSLTSGQTDASFMDLSAAMGGTRGVNSDALLSVDQQLMKKEKQKVRAQLVVANWAGAPAGQEHLILGARDGIVTDQGTAEALRWEQKHEGQAMDFVQFIRFLRAVEVATFEQQVTWTYLLFQQDGRMLPGHIIHQAKQIAPVFLGEKEGSAISIVTCVSEFFGETASMSLDEWRVGCREDRGIVGRRIKNAPLVGAFGTYAFLMRQITVLREHVNHLSCQGRLWIGRVPHKVKVESGYLSMVLASNEHLGYTETYHLVGATVIPDPRRPSRFDVVLENAPRLRFDAGGEGQAQSWINAVLTNVLPATSAYRFDSFAPVRDHARCKWYVDGADYFGDLLLAIRAATSEVLITDWSMSPEIYLERDKGEASARLDLALIARATAGVQVRIMLWWQSNMATQGTVNANYVVKRFEGIPNIAVLLHPGGTLPSKWSHHQKSVIVDRTLAFCGGLDLCYGRYDTRAHELTDGCHLRTRFPGKDFYNPGISSCDKLDFPWEEKLDRYSHPREPWHDIQIGTSGGCARDLARNFVQRWNHHLKETAAAGTHPIMKPVSEAAAEVVPAVDPFAFWTTTSLACQAQVCRSLSRWSGNHQTERSIYNAYLYAIEQADHFIYIENQFFISSQGPIQNKVVDALVKRIRRAIVEGAAFRVVVVLPFHPEGSFDSTATRILFKLAHDTIAYMKRAVEKDHPLHKFSDYVHFGSPLQHAQILERFFVQLIYVHSKLMIVDDRLVICGSANINDRSMLGDRDSELAIVVEGDRDLPGTLAGKPYQMATFAHTLRMSLWREHLGLSATEDAVVQDPASLAAFEYWKSVAQANERLIAPIVDITPADVYAIVASGVPPSVKRHRLSLHLHHEGAATATDKGKEEAAAAVLPVDETVVAQGRLTLVDAAGVEDMVQAQLRGSSLHFASEASQLPRGSLELKPEMRVVEWSGHPLGFMLASPEARHHFSCESDALRYYWIEALRNKLSGLKKSMFRHHAVGLGNATGLHKDGHLLDTARDFLTMDKETARRTAAERGEAPEDAPPAGEEPLEALKPVVVPKPLSPKPLRSPLALKESELRVIEAPETLPEGSDASEAATPRGQPRTPRSPRVAPAAVAEAPEKAIDVGSETDTSSDDMLEDELAARIHATGLHLQYAAHKAHVVIGEHAEKTKQKTKAMARKAKAFFKAVTHTEVGPRLAAVQGYLVGYPIDYRPRIPADMYAAMPWDLFGAWRRGAGEIVSAASHSSRAA